MATIHHLPQRQPARAFLEDVRREVVGGWAVEACVVEDGLTIPDRISVALQHLADVIPFPDNKKPRR